MAISAYAQAYTATFARRVITEILRECRSPERPLLEEELVLGLDLVHEKPELAQESLQLKRRRVELKQPETSLYGKAPSWHDIFRIVGYETPRVGGHRIGVENVVVKLIQQLVPEFTVKLVISCRGTDRHRIDGVDTNGDRYPWRKTVVVDRVSGEVRETGPAEEWVKLPRLKQIRSTGPAKLSLSIFGVSETPHNASFVPGSASGHDHSSGAAPRVSAEVPNPEISNASAEASSPADVPMSVEASTHDSEGSHNQESAPLEETIPKSIPTSGPKFRALGSEERAELKRLHVNLGHPDPNRFIKFLTERGASTAAIEGAKDMCCDTCLRQVFAAKNSLSRVNGFTPEQCLLGKSRHLPGSVLSDPEASSHALADSDTPEGVQFRQNLLRREVARKAYVQADNDSSFRRALLRQSRPGKVEFMQGDWVLYWRSNRGNSRICPGRWHGPAQVVVSEKKRVVWLSHLGRLVRASPEQLRPASLREFSKLPRNADGVPEVPGSELGEKTSVEGTEENPENDFPDETRVELSPHEIPIPDAGDDDVLFGDDTVVGTGESGVWEITLEDQEWDTNLADAFCDHPELTEQIWLTTGEKRKRVEVNYRAQTPQDQALFDAAKSKEVKAWIDHGTVKRVAKGTLSADQVMRCRWILTWKSPAVGSTERRAKARLVVLGFEDPQIQSVHSDAPTLSKDARQLLLQQISSRRWKLINFDISTAFLKGKGDGRPLGIHAPQELRDGLGMKDGEQCSLTGGAYGRVDAPYLWYKALKSTLEELGFVTCPYDGCLFSLVTPGRDGKPRVRGILGVHVDDGLAGGDSYFHEVLAKLRKIYDFGAYNEGEFEFCGVRYRQWDDGTIEMDQCGYLEKIEPVEIPRSRRQTPEEGLSAVEVQQLRRICGSLQFAAVHTRPDLAAKVGILQSMVTKGKVQHLIDANRVLYEAKKHKVCLVIVPIAESRVTFCCFSDASFSTAKNLSSRQGTLIFSTDHGLAQNERTVVCPMAWSSKRIPRVVTSTLSAEAIALSSSLDRLGFIRICWEWIKDPSIDWSNPSEVLKRAPLSSAVTDCKSVYDIATKTSTPSCSEYRTTLECLLIRERLQENMEMRWISTQAMLADSLTKTMDSYLLRECLRTGKYALFDEEESLKQRASKRDKLKWINRKESGT
eukprot:s617_g37.t1